MDEHTLRIALEAWNNAQGAIDQLMRGLDDLEAKAKAVNRAMHFNASAGSTGKQASQSQLKALQDQLKVMQAQLNLQKAQAQYASSQASQSVAQLRQQNAQQKANHQAALQGIQQQMSQNAQAHQQQMNQLRQQTAAAKAARAQAAANGPSFGSRAGQGIGSLLSGATNVGAGIQGLTTQALGLVTTIQRGVGLLGDMGSMLVGTVATGFHVVEDAAKAVTTAVVGVGAAIGVTGVKFNAFKQDALETISILTKSPAKADSIFKEAVKIAIPAKFQVDEIVDTFRVLTAQGLDVQKVYKGTTQSLGQMVIGMAQVMDKVPQQVARAIGAVRAGRLAIVQMQALGIGKKELMDKGVEFDNRGAPTNREKLLPATLKLMEEKTAGGKVLTDMEDNFNTQLDSIGTFFKIWTASITEGFTKDFGKALDNVGNLFQALSEGAEPWMKTLNEAVKVPFEILGKLLLQASEKAPELGKALAEVFTADNVMNAIAEVYATVRSFFDDVMGLVEKATGKKGFVGIWEFFKDAAETAIDFVFRAWNALVEGFSWLMENGDKLWVKFLEGLGMVKGLIEVVAGLFALNFGAQLVTNLLGIASGILGIANALRTLVGLTGGGAAGAAIRGAAGGAAAAAGSGAIGVGGAAAVAGGGFLGVGAGAALGAGSLAVAGGLAAGWAIQDHFDLWGNKKAQRGADAANAWSAQQKAHLAKMAAERGLAVDAHGNLVDAHGSVVKTGKARAGAGAAPGAGAGSIPASTQFEGPMGWLQGIGRGAIGWGAGTIGNAIPQDWKNMGADLMGRMQKGWGRGLNEVRGSSTYNRHKQEFLDFMNGGKGASGSANAGKQNGDNGLPPSTIIGGHLGGSEGANPMEALDSDLIGAQISAFEKSIKGNDSNQKAIVREGLIGLYKKQGEALKQAVDEASREANINVDDMGDPKDDARRKKDILEYWGAVKDFWANQSEIEEIQRQAVDAQNAMVQEALDGQIKMAQAQIELLPESQQAFATVGAIIPSLLGKQRALEAKIKQTAQGTKEYYESVGEFYKIEKQIQDLRNKATDQAADQAFKKPTRQFNVMKELIELLPKHLQGRAAKQILPNQVGAAFQAAQMARDPEERQDRMLQALRMFKDVKEMQKSGNAFGDFFENSMAAQRSSLLRRKPSKRQRGMRMRGTSPFAGTPFEAFLGMGGNMDDENLANLMGSFLGGQMGQPFTGQPGGGEAPKRKSMWEGYGPNPNMPGFVPPAAPEVPNNYYGYPVVPNGGVPSQPVGYPAAPAAPIAPVAGYGNGGTTVNLTINVNATSEDAVINMVSNEIRKVFRQQGGR